MAGAEIDDVSAARAGGVFVLLMVSMGVICAVFHQDSQDCVSHYPEGVALRALFACCNDRSGRVASAKLPQDGSIYGD